MGSTKLNVILFRNISSLHWKAYSTASDSFSQFSNEYKTLYVPTTTVQKCALSVGASIMSLLDPSRGGEIFLIGSSCLTKSQLAYPL